MSAKKRSSSKNQQGQQQSLYDSLKRHKEGQEINKEGQEVVLEHIQHEPTLLSSHVLETCMQEFAKFQGAVGRLKAPNTPASPRRTSIGPQDIFVDAKHECLHAGMQFVKLVRKYQAYGFDPSTQVVGNLVEIVMQWEKYRNIELAIEAFSLLKTMLIERPPSKCTTTLDNNTSSQVVPMQVVDADAWNPIKYKFEIQELSRWKDIYEFLVYITDRIRVVYEEKCSVVEQLGMFLMFEYLAKLLTLDAENRFQVAVKNMEEYSNSSKKVLKGSYLWRSIQLSIGIKVGFQALVRNLLEVISLPPETKFNQQMELEAIQGLDCVTEEAHKYAIPNFEELRLLCQQLFQLTVNFLGYCEDHKMFYRFHGRNNFRMQIDEVLIEEGLHRNWQILCRILQPKDRIRFCGLLISHYVGEDDPDKLEFSDSFSEGKYYLTCPTDLKQSWSIQPIEILKYLKSMEGFQFVTQTLFGESSVDENVHNLVNNFVTLVQDVALQELEGKQEEVDETILSIKEICKELEGVQGEWKNGSRQLQKCLEIIDELRN
eukprot:TRINITY_DN3806_c0_g1_i10.p1 TRINITY_DN3806_c0_g1~~TRINITY_DN3806_c0_g1_i10.p1  ORF type:complete len:543 (-),score=70.28 TRINITY_DN3806_c0_g1_i10:935-2563(-)